MVWMLIQVQRVEVIRKLCSEDEVNHLPAAFLPFQDGFGRVWMWGHGDPGSGSGGLGENTGAVSEGIADGGEFAEDAAETALEFLICFDVLVFPEVLWEMGEVVEG